jgi:hypothetical protein
MASIASTWQRFPNTWVAKIAVVLSVIAASILVSSMVKY